jgi:hypothetical protein
VEWRYSSTVLDLDTSWRWVVSFTALLLYLRGKSPRYLLASELGGPQRLSGRCGEEKILHCLESNPDRPAHSCGWINIKLSLYISCVDRTLHIRAVKFRRRSVFFPSVRGVLNWCRLVRVSRRKRFYPRRIHKVSALERTVFCLICINMATAFPGALPAGVKQREREADNLQLVPRSGIHGTADVTILAFSRHATVYEMLPKLVTNLRLCTDRSNGCVDNLPEFLSCFMYCICYN